MTHSPPTNSLRQYIAPGKVRSPRTLRGPLVALAVLGLLFIAADRCKELVPSAWAPGPGFGSTSFYALYPDAGMPGRAQFALVNVRIWARGEHVCTGMRMEVWWEHGRDGGPLTDRTPWKSIPDELKQAAKQAGKPVLLETRAEADEWVTAELAAALTRTASAFPTIDGASYFPPSAQRPTDYVVVHLDRLWLERLLGWHAGVNAVLWGAGGVAVIWLLVRIEAKSHAGSLARRGLCVGCGYARKGLPFGAVCPECGKRP